MPQHSTRNRKAAGGAAQGPHAPGADGARQSRRGEDAWGAQRQDPLPHGFLVGGVNSPVRAFRRVGAEPIHLARGQGAVVTDTAGRRYVDLIMGWGSLLLGHNAPTIRRAITRQLAAGTCLGLTTPPELRLASLIAAAVPSIDQVRFLTSGTEACMTALRLARGATGRPKILTFEGCYHGHSDGLLVKRGSGLATLGLAKSAGVPDAYAQETLIVPYNTPEALEAAFRQHGAQIAAAIVEPAAANMGVVAPQRGWLARLRELTRTHGALLVFDEVVTGFRLSASGAQGVYGITPDLTVLGKILGGGMPIGAVGGPAALMSQLTPEGPVYHAGTFAGHPVVMAAGIAALEQLAARPPYAALERLGARCEDGLRDGAVRAGVPVHINRAGSMLTVFFSERPVRNFEDAQRADANRFAVWANALRRRGVLVPPSPFETLFVSTAHTAAVVDRIIRAARTAFAEAGRRAARSGTSIAHHPADGGAVPGSVGA